MTNPTSTAENKGSLFRVFKPGQGTYTRLGTAGAAGLLIVLFCNYLADQLQNFPTLATEPLTRYSIAAGVLLVFIGIIWFVMNKPRHAQFLIETDNELKKVNWTSWKDLIVSTRVVIVFMLLLAVFLLLMDMLFGFGFFSIEVLKTNPFSFLNAFFNSTAP